MKNKLAAKLRVEYEKRVREAADKKNKSILQAKMDFEAEVKTIRLEIYHSSKEAKNEMSLY